MENELSSIKALKKSSKVALINQINEFNDIKNGTMDRITKLMKSYSIYFEKGFSFVSQISEILQKDRANIKVYFLFLFIYFYLFLFINYFFIQLIIT